MAQAHCPHCIFVFVWLRSLLCLLLLLGDGPGHLMLLHQLLLVEAEKEAVPRLFMFLGMRLLEKEKRRR